MEDCFEKYVCVCVCVYQTVFFKYSPVFIDVDTQF